jgi:dUTP pyrophosphatase
MIQFAKVHSDATIPRRANPFDAGMDLSACESSSIPPRGRAIVDTGLVVLFPPTCYARVAPRSGLAAKHGLDVLAGVIDCTYTGNIKVILQNNSDTVFDVACGDRIAQLIFEQVYIPCAQNVKEVSLEEIKLNTANMCENAVRGDAGFGSTGVAN